MNLVVMNGRQKLCQFHMGGGTVLQLQCIRGGSITSYAQRKTKKETRGKDEASCIGR
jgi:hypothetical protein